MADAWVMRVVGTAFVAWDPFPVRWLSRYDPDANAGRGSIELTEDIARAKRFASGQEVLEEWRRVSAILPTRLDGKPNRPLSAFTISPERVQEPHDQHPQEPDR